MSYSTRRNSKRRYWRPIRFLLTSKKCWVISIALISTILLFLHFYLLPIANGEYNSECYLDDIDHKNLRYAIQMIGKTMQKHNVTYWLDYGTLLGAVRSKDVLSWDSDADISYLLTDEKHSFHKELHELGIFSNPLHAFYKGRTIDYMRWQKKPGQFEGENDILLYKYYPQSVLQNENVIVLHHMKLETFPLSWVQPTKMADFNGVQLAIPNVPHKLLRHRYPFSYPLGVSIPYKWKCYIPCWARNARGC